MLNIFFVFYKKKNDMTWKPALFCTSVDKSLVSESCGQFLLEFQEAVLNKAGRSASDMKLGAMGAIGRKTKHACKHIIMYLLKAGKQLHRSILTPS